MTAIKNFRYDINALRAIAITSVLGFHFKIPYFSGGFCGVDIFFVISGYLMSKIIMDSSDKHQFSFIDFYAARLKRILPALLFLLSTITLLCFFLYFPPDYEAIEKYAASSILFVSNIFYWRISSYFAPVSDNNILLHTWSLSVEWQFYILYPIVIVFVYKLLKDTHKYFVFFLSSTIVLFVFAVFFTTKQPQASFYLLPGRAWEMLCGGIAFSMQGRIKSNGSRKLTAITGYGLLIVSVAVLKSSYVWPGISTAIPVIGTFLVIVANWNEWLVLRNSFVKLTGKISYSLYLWHWPVLVLFQYFGFEKNLSSIGLLVCIAFTLAYISYTYVEQSNQFRSSKAILIAMGVLLVCTGFLSLVNVNQFVFKPQARYFSKYEISDEDEQKQFNDGCCFIDINNKISGRNAFNKKQCLFFDTTKKNVLLIGDSHAAELSLSLKEALGKKGINMLQATVSECFPFERTNGVPRSYAVMNYIYRDFIVNNSKRIDGIILDAHWFRNFNNLNKLLDDLKSTINYINKYDIKVIVIGQTESYMLRYPTIVAKEYQFNKNVTAHFLNRDTYITNQFLLKKLPSVYIDIFNLNPKTPVSAADTPYMFDNNHYSKYGADLATQKILSNAIAEKFFKSVLH